MGKAQKAFTVPLKGNLTINNAETLRDTLLKNLQQNKILNIDFSELEEMDVSILQILCALQHEADAESHTIQFSGTLSLEVKQFLLICGLITGLQFSDQEILEQTMQRMKQNND